MREREVGGGRRKEGRKRGRMSGGREGRRKGGRERGRERGREGSEGVNQLTIKTYGFWLLKEPRRCGSPMKTRSGGMSLCRVREYSLRLPSS